MRLVVGLLALTLSGSIALAEEAKAPEPQPEAPAVTTEAPRAKANLRVVRILPETRQALLFDKNRGTHVLAEVGTAIAGYTVEAIEEDEVTLAANGKELVLAAPARGSWRRAREAAATTPVAPADPYGEPAGAIVDPFAPSDPYAADADGPVDPYAEPKPRVVTAPSPIVVGEGGIRVADAGGPADPYLESPSNAGRAAPSEAPIVDAGAPPAAPVITPTVLSRSELNVALANFGTLTSLVRGGFTAQGARLDVVAEGSVFAKAGLRSGDIVTAVDNTQLRSIDDAADLYVRASATRAANLHVLRAGKPLTLRVLIH